MSEQEGAACLSSDTCLRVDENYFGHSMEVTSVQSGDEILAAIDQCKRSIGLVTEEMSDEKRDLVQQLVRLRLRLQDVREMEIYGDPANLRIVLGHKFVSQTIQLKIPQSTQLHCDACASLIWAPLQSWFTCTECNYIAHRHCLGCVKRSCAAVVINERPHYELRICPETNLEEQNYRCIECSTAISYSSTLSQPLLCDYTGRYYCKDCHWSGSVVIPARVLLNWDFEPRPVAQASKQYLKLMLRKPAIHVEAVNPHLFSLVEELAIVKKLRVDILVMKEYIVSCKDALETKLLWLLHDRQHFVENCDHYSLQDLIDVAAKDLISYLQPIYDRFVVHITRDCLGCRGKGHVCRLCDQPPIVFPFETGAALCSTCHAVYHKSCLIKRETLCLRCQTKCPSSAI